MKKFIFTSIALMSAIGLQAENAQIDIEHGNVSYKAVQTDFAEGPIKTDDSYSDISFTMATASGAITDARTSYFKVTEFYEYDLTADYTSGTNVDLTNFTEIVTDAIAIQAGSSNIDDATWYTFEDNEYKYLMDSLASVGMVVPYNKLNAASGYFYFLLDTDDGEYYKYKATSLVQLQDRYPDCENVYYYYDSSKNFYYAINRVGIAIKTVTLVSTQKNYTVKYISEEAFQYNTKLQGVTIGKDIVDINAISFKGASNIQLTLESNSNAYTYSNGILYDAEMNKIILASSNVNSQTIAYSVSEIGEYAFYNTQNDIVITSTNKNIIVGENQSNKVTFSHPSDYLDITPLPNNGYKVSGSIVQDNIDSLHFKGAYMDFTDAILLEKIEMNNAKYLNDSTLLYFNTNITLSGRNIINKDRCENLIITDKRSFYCPKAFTATKATYTRTFNHTDWSTICLPFNVDDISDKLILGSLAGFSDGIFTFNIADNISANRPYLARSVDDSYSTIVGTNTYVPATTDGQFTTTRNVATFTGVLEPQYVKSDENTYYYGVGTIDGVTNIVKLKNAKVNPYRAYLSVPANSIENNSATFRFVDLFDNEIFSFEASETTGIENVKSSTTNNIYNINGQRLNKANRGLNIINGKVVINK
jgi:hypothetical protein